MKRTLTERKARKVRERSPLFYRSCDKCDAQIKREKMWFFWGQTGLSSDPWPYMWHLCKECAPTHDAAVAYFENHKEFTL